MYMRTKKLNCPSCKKPFRPGGPWPSEDPELPTAKQTSEKFDLIVLDPPKFARSLAAYDTALKGYRRLQALALQLLNPDGILILCCCSGVIKMTDLEEISAQVATEARRPLQILERHGQPPDHPVSLACPETSYLKCLIFRVM
jgi:23S rRNA (cytosine1962-C5)-methyltransferase